MARLFGLEILRMADADVLPLDYREYGEEVGAYIDAAQKKAQTQFGVRAVNFDSAVRAAQRFAEAGAKVLREQKNPPDDATSLNNKLRRAERALLIPDGLPNRPWFRHAIFAPGQYTGYTAVVLPGINEAIDRSDLARTRDEVAALSAALNRATKLLSARH